MQNDLKVLFFGDVIGKPGRNVLERYLKTPRADFIVVNGENIASGIGITTSTAMELLELGVDVITTGNHVWKKREIIPFIMEENRLLRPLNYPEGTPGFGFVLARKDRKSLYVVNIEGRIFMNPLPCPFLAMEKFFEQADKSIPVIVDFHAEATSEKIAMGWFLDGKVSAVVGTHTHVQTADERVLTNGTGYITDVGMTGPADSVIGMEKKVVLERFLTQLPQKFEVGKDDIEVQGVVVTIDVTSRKCISIERIKEKIL